MRPTQKTSKSNETNTKDLHPALDKCVHKDLHIKWDKHKRHLHQMRRPTKGIGIKCVHRDLDIKWDPRQQTSQSNETYNRYLNQMCPRRPRHQMRPKTTDISIKWDLQQISQSNVSTKTSTSNETNTKDIQIKWDLQKETYILLSLRHPQHPALPPQCV